MKAITVTPLEAWLLTEGMVNVIAHGRRTPYRGEILIGSSAITPEGVDAYTNFWRTIGTGQHPVNWASTVPQQGYVAIARLTDIIPYDEMQLNLNNRPIEGVLPIKKWMLVFKDVEVLVNPLSVRQDTGIRDFDLKDLRPSRYFPVPAEQIQELYETCLNLERSNSCGDNYLLDSAHFVLALPAYEKLRKKLFRHDKGRYFLRRRKWRKAFAQAFPDFTSEPILKGTD